MGEITLNERFGQSIAHITKKYLLKKVLEIGSWDGTGSTQCFIEGMKDLPGRSLTCLEVESSRYDSLLQTTSKYSEWVKCHNLSSISFDALVYKDFEEIWRSPYNEIPGSPADTDTDQGDLQKKELVKSWWQQDTTNLKRYKKGFLELYPDEFYDGVLIDGSEFAGYSEFKLLKDRVGVFFLDDYFKAFKTNQIARELDDDPNYMILDAQPRHRNGWAIIGRKDYLGFI